MQGTVTWGKGRIPNSVHLNLKTNTLCTMEELLSFSCHKSSISLSFLFPISLPLLYNRIKNWKIKIIFTVSIWRVWQKAHGLGLQWISELEKRSCFLFSSLFSSFSHFYSSSMSCLFFLVSLRTTWAPTLHQRNSKITGGPWGHRHQGKKREEQEGGGKTWGARSPECFWQEWLGMKVTALNYWIWTGAVAFYLYLPS